MPTNRILLTGGAGFLGRAVEKELVSWGIHPNRIDIPRSHQYNLTDPDAVRMLFADCRPTHIIHLAAEVGGIGANRISPGRFFYANLMMGLNLIEQARKSGVTKFVQVGTVCSYPKHSRLPFREDDLWNGYPEETNAPYGIAKKALLVMLQAYRKQYHLNGIYLIPVNLYGPGDNFNQATSHVIPAMIRKFSEAVQSGSPRVALWGTGMAGREFLYVDDAARGIVAALESYNDPEPVNLGTGSEITISDLAQKIARLTGFDGTIIWDATKPDGQPRRCLDTTRAAERFGFIAEIGLDEGLKRTVEWYRGQTASST